MGTRWAVPPFAAVLCPEHTGEPVSGASGRAVDRDGPRGAAANVVRNITTVRDSTDDLHGACEPFFFCKNCPLNSFMENKKTINVTCKTNTLQKKIKINLSLMIFYNHFLLKKELPLLGPIGLTLEFHKCSADLLGAFLDHNHVVFRT